MDARFSKLKIIVDLFLAPNNVLKALIPLVGVGKVKKHFGLLICLCGMIFIIPTGTAAAQAQTPQYRSYLRQGLEKALNLEWQSAFGHLNKAVELDREDPAGYAFLAVAHLFASELSFAEKERLAYQGPMLRYAGEALAKGQKRVERHPEDGQAYFAMALTAIVKIRWAMKQRSYLTVAQEAARAWDNIRRAKAANPQDYDIYLLMGMFHYHIDQLSALTRFLSSLLITSGDRSLGLQELRLAVQKGELLKELAQAELSAVLINFEKQPAQALSLILSLRDQFPGNYHLSFGLATTYSELLRFEEAFTIARELERGIQSGKPPYVPQLQSRHDNLMGRILFNQGDYAKAAEALQKVIGNEAHYNIHNRAFALLRLGMIHDVRRDRKQAREYYTRILEIEGVEGSARVQAKQYLREPYVLPARS